MSTGKPNCPKGVTIDPAYLEQRIKAKFDTVSAFARQLGIEPNAIRQWLQRKTKPEGRRIFQIAAALDLTEQQINTLLCVPETKIDFRTPYNIVSESDAETRARRIADTFFSLDANRHIIKSGALSVTSKTVAKTVADHIRNSLGISSDEPATLSRLVSAAKRVDLSVLFLPFKQFGITLSEKRTKEAAFIAERGDAKIIFLDIDYSIDQIAFNLGHEIAHIVIDENVFRDSEKTEKFCNSVAQELLYPKAYLSAHKILRETLSEKAASSKAEIKKITAGLCREFDWSHMGIALAMHSNRFIKKDSPSYKCLMAIHHSTKRRSLASLFFANLVSDDIDKLEQFFSQDIYSAHDFNGAFFVFKEGVVNEQISYRRLAEILSIDAGDADELAQAWREEVEEGVSDKDGRRAQESFG